MKHKNKALGVPGAAVVALLVASSTAHAAVIKLKLGDINAGSETVTLVTNGDFENTGSGNTHTPTDWNRTGDMFYDYNNSATVASMGTHTAKMHIDGGNEGKYWQTVALTANTDYVLSAYIFHLGDETHGGSAQLDLNDMSGEPDDGGGSISISQSNADANGGYFVYGTFNSGSTTSTDIRAFMTAGGLPTTDWPNQPVSALWDNIAITEASVFVAPTLVPEPTSALLGGLGVLLLIRRRRN